VTRHDSARWRAEDHGVSTVAVIGGGFTGAAVAYHLARQAAPASVRVVVAEPRPTLGAGLAYSAHDPAFRINVPAGRMSLIAGQSSHFQEWLEASGELDADGEAWASGGRVFPRRSVFGRYVAGQIEPLLRARRVEHRRDRAVAVERGPRGYTVSFAAGGEPLEADFVVLAATHPKPSIPAAMRAVADHPRFVPDVYGDGGISRIGSGDRVLLVGNGLSASDAIASLDARGHSGPILSLSRRGLRSRGHPDAPVSARGDFSTAPARTALELLMRVRREVAAAAHAGTSWHGVLDAAREQAGAIWGALPPRERRRLVRHLRAFWDVHRFRVAPQVDAVIRRRTGDGSLVLMAGSVLAAEATSRGIRVTLRRRGDRAAGEAEFDAVIIATGPDHTAAIEANEAVRSLADQGLLRLDPTGLGLAVSSRSLALDRTGREVPGLLVAGPLARGTFGELMGLPEVARHAETVAGELALLMARSRKGADGSA
jgi:uncharacterized NAD(P)/FAD-binding protein YdhS